MGPEYSIGYGKFCKREYKAKIKALDSAQDLHRARIDALIPSAARLAHARVKRGEASKEVVGVDGNPYMNDMFSQYFHEEMDRMKREKGLIA